MRKLLAGLLLSLFLCVFGVPAQAVNYVVVPTCGTLPSTPAVGSANGPIAVDQNGNICGSSSAAAGSATSANQATQIAAVGSPGATACATDTGSCSLNALLQRLAQRLTSILTSTLTTQTPGFSFVNISTSATTVAKSGAGVFHCATVNTLGTVASTTTIYDNTAGSGTIIAIINSLTLSGSFCFDVAFATGLTIVTTGTAAPNVTVSYR